MKNRVVEISTDGHHLSKLRGFMVVSSQDGDSKIPLDDIGVVLVSGRGATYTNSLLTALAQRCVPLVICSENFIPVAWIWPIEGHHIQAHHIRAQIETSKPICKQIWRDIVRAKITQQAAVVESIRGTGKALQLQAKRVRSGDPENVESQVARKYWPILFGTTFRRRRSAGQINGLLNYGYAILRSASARAVVASGLHPSIGLHHSNRYDSLQLADDLMEPFRPMVDATVYSIVRNGKTELDSEAKRMLAKILNLDMQTSFGTTPVATCVLRLAQSVAHSFVSKTVDLELPYKATPLETWPPHEQPSLIGLSNDVDSHDV